MSQRKIIFGQQKKYGLFLEIVFHQIFFWKATLSHKKLNKRS